MCVDGGREEGKISVGKGRSRGENRGGRHKEEWEGMGKNH